MYKTDFERERVILVGVDTGDGAITVDDCLDELDELAKTSGAESVGRLIQKLDHAHPKHYLGKGKIDELKDLISLTDATGIVCDDELTSAQHRNLERMLDTKIMDRTLVILDIFAKHATTSEGKVQVELAQQKYNISHLAGIHKDLSRLGGGIGTRGPGEKKLETDRRHIRNRILELEAQLKEIERHRDVLREGRAKQNVPVISLVGYTNAGKSTLMNALTLPLDAAGEKLGDGESMGVFVSDRLFATLTTSARRFALSTGEEALLTDTVGFIQKLPHHLVKAFRTTLDELKYADLLLHVADISDPAQKEKADVVDETLRKLGVNDKPVISVLNKTDKLENTDSSGAAQPVKSTSGTTAPQSPSLKPVKISALNKTGLTELDATICEILRNSRQVIKILVPYPDGQIINKIHRFGSILTEEHREAGVYMEILGDAELLGRVEQYRV